MKAIEELEQQLGKLHDNVFLGVDVQWREAVVTFRVRASSGPKRIVVNGFTRLVCPRANPWGPSVCIIGGSVSRDALGTAIKLTIEMQSGDEIIVDGTDVDLITSEE